jgi:hypothetical protein
MRGDLRGTVVDADLDASGTPLLPNALLDFLTTRIDLLDAETRTSPGCLDSLTVPRLRLVVLEQEGADCRSQVDQSALEGDDGLCQRRE